MATLARCLSLESKRWGTWLNVRGGSPILVTTEEKRGRQANTGVSSGRYFSIHNYEMYVCVRRLHQFTIAAALQCKKKKVSRKRDEGSKSETWRQRITKSWERSFLLANWIESFGSCKATGVCCCNSTVLLWYGGPFFHTYSTSIWVLKNRTNVIANKGESLVCLLSSLCFRISSVKRTLLNPQRTRLLPFLTLPAFAIDLVICLILIGADPTCEHSLQHPLSAILSSSIISAPISHALPCNHQEGYGPDHFTVKSFTQKRV
jgi:hypothetical protein